MRVKTKRRIRMLQRKNKYTRKHRRRGGGLFTSRLKIPGIGSFSQETGPQVYDPVTGTWKRQTCYGVMGFKTCK